MRGPSLGLPHSPGKKFYDALGAGPGVSRKACHESGRHVRRGHVLQLQAENVAKCRATFGVGVGRRLAHVVSPDCVDLAE